MKVHKWCIETTRVNTWLGYRHSITSMYHVSCHEDYLIKIHLNCTECYFKVIRTCM